MFRNVGGQFSDQYSTQHFPHPHIRRSYQPSDSHPRSCSELSSSQMRHSSCAVAAAHKRAAVRAAAAGAQRIRSEQTRDRESRVAPHMLMLLELLLFVLVLRPPVRVCFHFDIFYQFGQCVPERVEAARSFTALSDCSIDVDERSTGERQIRRHQNGGRRHFARLPPVVKLA